MIDDDLNISRLRLLYLERNKEWNNLNKINQKIKDLEDSISPNKLRYL